MAGSGRAPGHSGLSEKSQKAKKLASGHCEELGLRFWGETHWQPDVNELWDVLCGFDGENLLMWKDTSSRAWHRHRRLWVVEMRFQLRKNSPILCPGKEFREPLALIPSGVIFCVLPLATFDPRTVINTLLLTWLEVDNFPVTVQIPTAYEKLPLSLAWVFGKLRTFTCLIQI